MTAVSFLIGALFGACIASIAFGLWAWEAMSPYDAPERPTSADWGAGKGQVPAVAENAPETAEMLAERMRGQAEHVARESIKGVKG